ncbi:MAG: imidazole glycerol phosphate synthase cyclase subunit [Alphaproteobacteria bacterium]|nr:imidazole glycerol phosphate synthase cyclase subunit [Alphaproteobacteria bacterium]
MLKKRIIPKLLIRHKEFGPVIRPILVTTNLYQSETVVGDPVSQAKIYEAQLADELLVLNIDRLDIASNDHLISLLKRLASETFMPITCGGGVSTASDFELLLNTGADKVSINTAAVTQPGLVEEASKRFGNQCVVVSIDFKVDPKTGQATVFSESGKTDTGIDLMSHVERVTQDGAGEILLTDIDRDGTGAGLNIEIGRKVANKINIPVILSGGVGLANHFVEGFRDAEAEGVAAGTFFCLRDQNPMQARAHVNSARIPIRLEN